MPGEEESKTAGYQQPTKASQGQKAKGKSASPGKSTRRKSGGGRGGGNHSPSQKGTGGRGGGRHSPSYKGPGGAGRGRGGAISQGNDRSSSVFNTNPHGSFRTLFESNHPQPMLKTSGKGASGDRSPRSTPDKDGTVAGGSSPQTAPQMGNPSIVHGQKSGGWSPQSAGAQSKSESTEVRFRIPHTDPPRHVVHREIGQDPGPPCFPASGNAQKGVASTWSKQDLHVDTNMGTESSIEANVSNRSAMVPNKLQYEPVGGSGQGSSRMNPEAPSYTPTFAQEDVGGELPLKTPMPTVMEEDPLKRGTFSGGLLGTASGSTIHEMTPAVDGADHTSR